MVVDLKVDVIIVANLFDSDTCLGPHTANMSLYIVIRYTYKVSFKDHFHENTSIFNK